MISGTKISQLPVVTNLFTTDFLPIARGGQTFRISGETFANTITGNNIGEGIGIYDSNLNGVLNFKSLSGIGSVKVYLDINNNLVLSGDVTEPFDFNILSQPITALNVVGISAINTSDSSLGQVLVSQGPSEPVRWETLPIQSSSNNVPNFIVIRDNTGNFYATTVIANLSGNASTASAWQTARTITLADGVVGSASFDGSQNFIVNTTIGTAVITDTNIASNANISDTKLAPINTSNKVSTNAIDTTTSQPGQILISTGAGSPAQWQNIPQVTTQSILPNSITTPLIAAGAVTVDKTNGTSENIGDTFVVRDSNGDFSARRVNASLQGNADTATSWLSPRRLTLLGAFSGTGEFDGTQDVTIVTQGENIASGWVNFNGTEKETISGTYYQNNTNSLVIETPNITKTVELTASFTQGTSSSTSFDVEATLFAGEYIDDIDFLNEYFSPGNSVLISLSSLDPLIPNTPLETLSSFFTQEYDILTFNSSTKTFTFTTQFSQALSGVISVTVDRVLQTLSVPYLTGYGVNAEFTSGELFFFNTEVTSLTGIYQQGTPTIGSNEIVVSLLAGDDFGNSQFASNYLTNGKIVSATFFNGEALFNTFVNPDSGEYTIQNNITDFTFTLSSSITQGASGEVIIDVLKQTSLSSTQLLINELPLSGLYIISNLSVPTLTSFALSSTTLQTITGDVVLYKNKINNFSNIHSVVTKDVGDYIINFYPIKDNEYYAHTGSVRTSGDNLSIGTLTTHNSDYKDQNKLQIRTILNNGTLNYFNSTEVNVITYG